MPISVPNPATGGPATAARTLRVASVSYLNAKPLIHGLDAVPGVELALDVPSRLAAGLVEGRSDVALLPVIDYQRIPNLRLVTAGGIGCDGPTLTVRIFSGRPIAAIRTLACDGDSSTSVALARIILAERYGIRPRFIEWPGVTARHYDATLLIGDKVVCQEPAGMDHQLDLGAAWKELTGLPFVFAMWTARAGVDLGDLPRRLEEAKERGLEHAREIVTRYAIPRGWPEGVALQYLTVYLRYDVTPRHLEAVRLFHELAAKHGVLEAASLRDLDVYGGATV